MQHPLCTLVCNTLCVPWYAIPWCTLVCNTLYVPWYATPWCTMVFNTPYWHWQTHCIASPHYTLLLLNPMLIVPDIRIKSPWYAIPWCTLVPWYAMQHPLVYWYWQTTMSLQCIVSHRASLLLSTDRPISFLRFAFAVPNIT